MSVPPGTDPRWLRPCAGTWREGAGPVLLCLPHAGAGALSFAGWEHHRLAGFEPVAVRLPGREERFEEEPVTDWAALVSLIADSLGGLAHRPLAVFGHSMGALTGFELLRELRRRGLPDPVLFAVSAHVAPQRMPRVARAPRTTDELLEYMRRLDRDGLGELLDDPEWREMVLRPLRGDLLLHDTYAYRELPPLGTPFVVLGGVQDPAMPEGAWTGWAELTSAGCARRGYPGGHFYLREQRGQLLGDLSGDLERALGTSRATAEGGGR
ncbi:thioesterase II family protein [Streptomyces cinnamoneus]|uniref:Thioesterase n=1 Tax=Streptomyces cinnamoneus TaxID=53446 RepID=A0A918WH77_STRCJ|nr:thioesterase domain-containing protein [Streptomyces cinnamoneus]GHC43904.1 thioesterase [Streptomyces cinnamoneus]